MATPPVVVPEKEPELSQAALTEATRFEDRDLRRDETVRTNIHIAGLLVFWVFISVLLVMGLVLAWHLVAPEKWRFLNGDQRGDLEMALLSALGSSFATVLSKKWLNPKL